MRAPARTLRAHAVFLALSPDRLFARFTRPERSSAAGTDQAGNDRCFKARCEQTLPCVAILHSVPRSSLASGGPEWASCGSCVFLAPMPALRSIPLPLRKRKRHTLCAAKVYKGDGMGWDGRGGEGREGRGGEGMGWDGRRGEGRALKLESLSLSERGQPSFGSSATFYREPGGSSPICWGSWQFFSYANSSSTCVRCTHLLKI